MTRMLTTAGLASCAMVRNVVASTGPDSGALLVAGTVSDWRTTPASRSSRERSPCRTTSETKAMSTP